MSQKIVVIGCGVVGAAIAYELSRIPHFTITVLDPFPPAQAATGAALGVLMGIISQKVKGRAWNLRQTSIRRYATLIPELEALTGRKIPWNPQGILRLCFAGEDLSRWETLIKTRHAQGWRLEQWNKTDLNAACPYISHLLTSAIYSPQDLQIDPTALTLALVAAAQKNGATFRFDARVEKLNGAPTCHQVQTQTESIAADWIVVSAGLGSAALTQTAAQPVEILPVLGQALRLKISPPITPQFHPTINGDDTHIVPLGNGEYWVGATVEFPNEMGEVVAAEGLLEKVLEGAIALYPALADSSILQTWTGLRPRPHNRPAPIIEPMSGYSNVFLATGHYRNGVLLSPATALMVRDAACEFFGTPRPLN